MNRDGEIKEINKIVTKSQRQEIREKLNTGFAANFASLLKNKNEINESSFIGTGQRSAWWLLNELECVLNGLVTFPAAYWTKEQNKATILVFRVNKQ